MKPAHAIVSAMNPKTLVMKNVTYDVVESFGADRALINFDGDVVFVDWDAAAGVFGMWELSGVPARDGAEKEAVARWVDAMSTSVTVTKLE